MSAWACRRAGAVGKRQRQVRTSTWDGVFESSSSVTEMRGAAGRHSLCCSRAVEFSVLPYLLTPRTVLTYTAYLLRLTLVEGAPRRRVTASAPYAPDQMQGDATHASSSVSRGVDLSQPVQACFSVNQTGTKPTGPAAPRLQPERVGPSQYVQASRMNATAMAPPTYA